MDGLVRFGLSMKGVPEEAIDAIDRLVGLEPQLTKILPSFIPILTKAWPDIVLAAPHVVKLIKGNST